MNAKSASINNSFSQSIDPQPTLASDIKHIKPSQVFLEGKRREEEKRAN